MTSGSAIEPFYFHGTYETHLDDPTRGGLWYESFIGTPRLRGFGQTGHVALQLISQPTRPFCLCLLTLTAILNLATYRPTVRVCRASCQLNYQSTICRYISISDTLGATKDEHKHCPQGRRTAKASCLRRMPYAALDDLALRIVF